MKTKITATVLSLIIFLIIAPVAHAQIFAPKWVINDIPPNEANERFYNDITTQLNRPALSVVGFDNGDDHSKGYGLRQILNQAYVYGSNAQKDLIIRILDEVDEDITINPITRDDYQRNSNILQYRAFEALASYVLEQNGRDPNSFGIPMRDHDDAVATR